MLEEHNDFFFFTILFFILKLCSNRQSRETDYIFKKLYIAYSWVTIHPLNSSVLIFPSSPSAWNNFFIFTQLKLGGILGEKRTQLVFHTHDLEFLGSFYLGLTPWPWAGSTEAFGSLSLRAPPPATPLLPWNPLSGSWAATASRCGEHLTPHWAHAPGLAGSVSSCPKGGTWAVRGVKVTCLQSLRGALLSGGVGLLTVHL